jgi:hypothetical protein
MIRKLNTLILMIAVLLMGACMQKEDAAIPKEGDIVTWRGNQLLIIKAVLGQRRLHTEKNLFYPLVEEQFIGQFPIDYVPKPFPKLTEKEAIALEATEKERLKEYDQPMHNDIVFNLMLNGSTAIPTDQNPTGGKVDHPDQVKVKITRYSLYYADLAYKRSELTKYYERDLRMQRDYQLAVMKQDLEINTKVTKAGLDCYEYKSSLPKNNPQRECFAHSDTPLSTDYHFTVLADGARRDIQVNRYTAGYMLVWYTDKKNIYRAKEIDAAIWRLLDAWNVSPFNAPPLPVNHQN